MPCFYNNILAVTYGELVPEFFSTIDYLKKKVSIDEKRGYGLKRARVGGNGREALLEFDSLPVHIQERIGDPRKVEHILERFYKVDTDAVRFYLTHTFDDAESSHIKGEIQAKYVVNASMLRAVHDLKIAREHEIISKGFRPKNLFQSLCSDAESFNAVLLKKYQTEHTLPSNYRRFKDVYDKFVEHGYISLISAKHNNKNSVKVNEQVLEFLNNLFGDKDTKPNVTDVHRQYCDFKSGFCEIFNKSTGEQYQPDDFPEITEATMRSHLMEWENRIGTYARRSGNRQELIQEFVPAHKLRQSQYAGSVISVDDRQPPFWYNENRARVWFYMGYDDGSECFTVWVHGTSKEGLIIDFYRQMVRNYYEWGVNLPIDLECEASLNSNYRNTFLSDGRMFERVRIEANNARAKIIERKFRHLRYGVEKKHSGWLGRPFARLESNKPGPETKESVKKQMKPYKQIIEMSLANIEEWNNTEHSKIKGQTRWEVFCSRQNPSTKPINWQGFLPFLGYKTETSCKAGIINLQHKKWVLGEDGEVYTGDNLIKLLKQVCDRNITVYWLNGNDGEVMKALVYVGDRYVCQAMPQPECARASAEQTVTDIEAFTLMARYKSTITGYMSHSMKAINDLLIVGEKPKTLNNKFKINNNGAIKDIGANFKFDASQTETEPQILEQPTEETVEIIETTNLKRTLLDRF